MSILEQINSPQELRSLASHQLPDIADELRQYLLETLNETGGHLGAGLGAVELTIALHYVFNTPDDRIVWDVGHQAYPHKVLTKRRELLKSIRKKGGLAPFPRREESIYDTFGVGHSSTSISAALGMAVGMEKAGSNNKAIAVIGDGAMTAGMAFEALNHGGDLKSNVIIVLNDNDMSISGNVGALSNYFARILSSKLYMNVRKGSKSMLGRIPPVWEFARKTESHLKGMMVPGTLFEELGFNYTGPFDGHDLPLLLKTFSNVKEFVGPQIIHVITQKGKGYRPAEQDPIKYHGVSTGFYSKANASEQAKADTAKTKESASPKTMASYSNIFGDWLCDMAAKDSRVVGITPAMREGSGLVRFANEFPDRYYDVGIAEQHSVTFAAGLACEKLKPVVAIYSTFLQRAYDQLIHDVAIQNLPVLFALDRAGLVGDGPTHSGNYDFSYLNCIPNMIIMAPSDANECRKMLTTGIEANCPSAVRYPRGAGPLVDIEPGLESLPIGKGKVVRQGSGIALLAFGSMVPTSLEVANEINATVADMRFVKPLDEDLILKLAKQHPIIVTLEENAILGGAGMGINKVLTDNDHQNKLINLGIPDHFVEHASPQEMLASCGLDKQGIIRQIVKKVRNSSCKSAQTLVESWDLTETA